jgi:hypothetical protein
LGRRTGSFIESFFIFILLVSLRHYVAQAGLEPSILLPSAGIADMYHHAWLLIEFRWKRKIE